MALTEFQLRQVAQAIGKSVTNLLNFNPDKRGLIKLVNFQIQELSRLAGINKTQAMRLLGELYKQEAARLNLPVSGLAKLLGKTPSAKLGLFLSRTLWSAAKNVFLDLLGFPIKTGGAAAAEAAVASRVAISASALAGWLGVAVVVAYIAAKGYEYLDREYFNPETKFIIDPVLNEVEPENFVVRNVEVVKTPPKPIKSTAAKPVLTVTPAKVDTFTRGYKRVTQLRIDVVAWRDDDDVDVIEVKGRAMASALGEVIVNSRLYQEAHPQFKVRPVVIAESIHPDVRKIADQLGITIIEV